MPQILAHHIVFGAYGFWLPNDPRGSWSVYVGSRDLYAHGGATTVYTPESRAYHEHDIQSRLAAKKDLKYPAVRFNGLQARAIARGFANYVAKRGLIVRACAIMPDHVHLIIDESGRDVESAVNQLKGAATRQLMDEQRHPLAAYAQHAVRPPKCWARGFWKVFLYDAQEVNEGIAYVEHNPERDGLNRQDWNFVRKFD